MKNKFVLTFVPVGNMFQPKIVFKNKERIIPLLLDIFLIDDVKLHLNKVKQQDFDFDLYCDVVAGACSYAMKYRER